MTIEYCPEDPIGDIRNKRIFIETYGCTYNIADSEKLEVILRSQGCEITVDIKEAEAIILNTCIVVERTEREMRKRIAELSREEVYITGCLPKVDGACGGVVIDPEAIHSHFRASGQHPAGGVAAIQIAQGCTGHCTYCITKQARGALVSYSEEEILRQVKGRIQNGATEIQLTALDVAAWGIDQEGGNLANLLDAICTVPGQYRIRIGMMNPDTIHPMLDRLLHACRNERIFLFFHIPIQSGSDAILTKMGRGYIRDDVISIISAIRDIFPSARISTDIICGFPGESDEDFEKTLDLIRIIRPEKINITRYSQRPGTPAADMHDMPDRFKKARSRKATILAQEIFSDIYEGFIGTEMDVIVTEIVKKGSVTTRDASYRPVIVMESLPIGSTHRIRVTGHRTHYLIGERVA